MKKTSFLFFLLLIIKVYSLEPVSHFGAKVNGIGLNIFIDKINPAKQLTLPKPQIGAVSRMGFGVTDKFTIYFDFNLNVQLNSDSGLIFNLDHFSGNVGFIATPVDSTVATLICDI